MDFDPYKRFYAIIRNIPRGRVATYGQIARLAGLPGNARQVGYALSTCNDRLPWHRVVNAKGEISSRGTPDAVDKQRVRLEKEKVTFGKAGRIRLARFQWNPKR
jgi:methylated-DNA-protein-cysteine methyltransferase-like protein